MDKLVARLGVVGKVSIRPSGETRFEALIATLPIADFASTTHVAIACAADHAMTMHDPRDCRDGLRATCNNGENIEWLTAIERSLVADRDSQRPAYTRAKARITSYSCMIGLYDCAKPLWITACGIAKPCDEG